ncbi:MAG: hypothetical protein KAQ79_08290, partial [Cyclobacteriaceae bacterium]|nr:hypothetical protein [Cyclobacteriaceae bacterium]
VFRFGHNNVWDIRLAEDNRDQIGTFDEIFAKVKSIPDTLQRLTDDPWYSNYRQMCRENYSKPYPRPFPCGSVVLGFDRRKAELTGYKLQIANGECRVSFILNDGRKAQLLVIMNQNNDRLMMQLQDEQGKVIENFFNRIKLIPDPKTPVDLPKYQIPEEVPDHIMSFGQRMPAREPHLWDYDEIHPEDRIFYLTAVSSIDLESKSRLNWDGLEEQMGPLEKGFKKTGKFWACIQLDEGLASGKKPDWELLSKFNNDEIADRRVESMQHWKTFWSKSGLVLEDDLLESIWYRNLYFFKCSAKSGVNCPGLFANWSYGNIGTAWHGDYHFNYNLQQPFWATFSSNHLELNLPYVELMEQVSDVAKTWAKEYYGLRGAYYPHSAYPVKMTMNPYPVPTWGWEICETPWAVQGVWWHYLYSGDIEFLRERGFPLIKDAVLFLVDYMKRPEASGPVWGDDRYHIFPTVPPELYGLRPGFDKNYDCLVDLTLSKFAFKAYLKAVSLLELDEEEKTLQADVKDILEHYPEYPTAVSKEYGKVFVSVPGEHPEVVYNVPNNLMTVFPGEEHGLHSSEDTMALLENTWANFQIEGGNDLVFQHLQAARIGKLDLEKFKRAIRYSMLPNGTCYDAVLQVHGRYSDNTNYQFMKENGIWFENFGLPAVINECLIQSYHGIVRFFPNWPGDRDAHFQDLRTTGAFLVSAQLTDGNIEEIKIKSEAGNIFKMYNPFDGKVKIIKQDETMIADGEIISIPTGKGETILIERH